VTAKPEANVPSEPGSFKVEYACANNISTRIVTVGDQVVLGQRSLVSSERPEEPFAAWWRSYITEQAAHASKVGRPFRFIDLFSSVGGLSLGAMEAIAAIGRRPVPILAADVDEGALQVYKANIRPRATIADSVRQMLDFRVSGAGESARFAYRPVVVDERLAAQSDIDLVLAGPPCQGHSSLNNYSRHDDPKNLLYLTVPAAAVALGARHVVIENVPNVVADKHGVVQTTLALLRSEGYKVSHGVLHADRMGWPQTRKRFFLVASRETQPTDLGVLATAMRREPLPVSWLISDLSERVLDNGDVMNSVPKLSAQNRARVNWLFDNGEYTLPNEIRPDCHKNGTTYPATYGRMYGDRAAPTITGGFLTPGRGRFLHPFSRRVLTPREAARIQGFPDWFDFVVNPGQPPSRSEVSRWIGNAVPSILGYTATLAALQAELSAVRTGDHEISIHAA